MAKIFADCVIAVSGTHKGNTQSKFATDLGCARTRISTCRFRVLIESQLKYVDVTRAAY